MTPTPTSNPWDATWTIVRADLDIAHVMLPLTGFRFQNTNAAVNPASYRVVHNQPPSVDCFAGALLHSAGVDTPSFADMGLSQLPIYSDAVAPQYANACAMLNTKLTQSTTVLRLEGLIRIAPATGAASRGVAPHAVIPKTVQLFQFSNGIAGGLPFLFVRTLLSPQSPVNGDGTAGGYGQY